MCPGSEEKKEAAGMNFDLILAGVGGQGVLSIAFVIDRAAIIEGLNFKQAEVHGMAQRGGAVESHLRLSDQEIYSDLIPKGKADLLLSVEPLEALRYLDYLRPDGLLITSTTPYVNIPNYPALTEVLTALKKVPRHLLVEAEAIAKEAGSIRTQNMVMVGAASPFLPLTPENLRKAVAELFASRGEKMVAINLQAFELGRNAASSHPLGDLSLKEN